MCSDHINKALRSAENVIRDFVVLYKALNTTTGFANMHILSVSQCVRWWSVLMKRVRTVSILSTIDWSCTTRRTTPTTEDNDGGTLECSILCLHLLTYVTYTRPNIMQNIQLRRSHMHTLLQPRLSCL